MNGVNIRRATDLSQSDLLLALNAPFFTTQQQVEVLFLSTLSRPPRDDCHRLIDLARAAGSPDDVTVMVADYRVRPDTARDMPMLAAE